MLKLAHNLISNLLFTVLAICILFTGVNIAYYAHELREMRKSFIYNLDYARSRMDIEMRFMYQQGCKQGIEYPEEYKQLSRQFYTENSPINWCNGKLDKLEDYVQGQVYNLGKPLGE